MPDQHGAPRRRKRGQGAREGVGTLYRTLCADSNGADPTFRKDRLAVLVRLGELHTASEKQVMLAPNLGVQARARKLHGDDDGKHSSLGRNASVYDARAWREARRRDEYA